MDKDAILKPKNVIECFFMIISTFLFISISLYIPNIGIIFVPILIVLLWLRCNRYIPLITVSTSVIMLSIIFSSIVPLTLGIVYTTIGVSLLVCIKKNMKFTNTVCILSLLITISNLINLTINIYIVMKSNFWKFAQDTIVNFNESLKLYYNANVMSSRYIESINKVMTPQNILSTLPTIIIIFSIITAFLIYVIIQKTLRKNNYKIDSIIDFDRWYLEPKVGTVLIVIICVTMFLYSKQIVFAEYIYKTAYSLLQFSVLITGLAVIKYFLKNKMKFNNKLCVGISILILISSLNIILIIGLVDLVIDVRSIDPNSLGTTLRKKLSL